MRSKFVTPKKIIPILFLLLLLVYYLFNISQDNIIIRLHDDQIDIQKFNNAIAEFIIEHGYGYQVEKVESTVKEIHDRLVKGEIDITLELWGENNLTWYQKEMNNGNIRDLGVLYDSGQQYWIIPEWYAREKQIKTVFDMTRHWRDFTNPGDPSKGVFFNCIFGWACRDINSVKLKAYGLDRYYNTVSPISPESLKSIYETAQKRKLPIFGYYWEPNSVMTNYEWFILEEPPYSEAIWVEIIQAAFNDTTASVNEACAFNHSGVHKIANSNLGSKAPNLVVMFKKMKIDIRFFNEMLSDRTGTGNDIPSFEKLAQIFLKNHPDKWNSWVTTPAKNKIEQALVNIKTSDTG